MDQEPATPEETTDPAGASAGDAARQPAGEGGQDATARTDDALAEEGEPAATRPDRTAAPDTAPERAPGPASGPDDAGGTDPEASVRRPRAAVFRVPATALLAVALLALCVSPFALGYPVLLAIFLGPLALAVWVVRTRTYADHEGLTVHRVFGRRAIPWSQVTSLRLTERSTVRAVLDGDDEVALPAVRVRHLPLLAAVSDGRIGDPRKHPAG